MVKVTDLKFTAASFKRWNKRQKFKVGTKQFQLAWRIERNLKTYEDVLKWDGASAKLKQMLKQFLLDELNELRDLRDAQIRQVMQ